MQARQEPCPYKPLRHERKKVRWDPGTNFETRGHAVSRRRKAQTTAGGLQRQNAMKGTIISLRRVCGQDLSRFVFASGDSEAELLQVYEPSPFSLSDDFDRLENLDFEPSPEPLLPTRENVDKFMHEFVQNSEQGLVQGSVQGSVHDSAQDDRAQAGLVPDSVQEDTVQADLVQDSVQDSAQDSAQDFVIRQQASWNVQRYPFAADRHVITQKKRHYHVLNFFGKPFRA